MYEFINEFIGSIILILKKFELKKYVILLNFNKSLIGLIGFDWSISSEFRTFEFPYCTPVVTVLYFGPNLKSLKKSLKKAG